jgi:hypothetical protein
MIILFQNHMANTVNLRLVKYFNPILNFLWCIKYVLNILSKI